MPHLPQVAAGYFTREFGSIFPLFPYAGYVLAGGILGIVLAGNKEIYKESQFMVYGHIKRKIVI